VELLKQTHVKYGLILCLILVICLTTMEITGQNQSFDNKSSVFILYQFIAPAVVWFLGIRAKKKQLGGKLTYKQGLTEGFKMSIVFAVVSPFIFMFYYLLINPAILSYVKGAYGMKEASDTTVILVDMVTQFVAAIIGGTLYGAILSYFLRSKS
jgi:hypothetical protein